jgi:hypothetical protein
MSTLRIWQDVGSACQLVPVFEMQRSDICDGWHRVPGYAEASRHLVPGDVVRDQPEEWCQRAGLAASPRTGQLSDPPGRGCINCGARWFDPAAIGCRVGWRWTRPTGAVPRKVL